ncbi:Jouberin [Irineochytrium annulatum]|nr:Jouberin [Irineochytrium annulatum]
MQSRGRSTTPQRKAKKKKSKKKADENTEQPNGDRALSRLANASITTDKKTKKKKKQSFRSGSRTKSGKRKGKKKQDAEPVLEESAIVRLFSECDIKDPEFYHNSIINVHVRGADKLSPNATILNPLVKIHFIDTATGLYVHKENSLIPATTYHETGQIKHVVPILTKVFTHVVPTRSIHILQPFSLAKNHTTAPNWDENIVVNIPYMSLLSETHALFFEILDFESGKHLESGWNRIAWAFLFVVGGTKKVNTERPARLQLYKYHQIRANDYGEIPLVFEMWKMGKRIKYPSTLHVEIKARPYLHEQLVQYRPLHAMQKEQGKLTFEELMQEYLSNRFVEASNLNLANMNKQAQWSRVPGETCKIPNKLVFALDSGASGSLSCSFSSSGLFLAVACSSNDLHTIKLFDAITGQRVASLPGHRDIIYELSWAPDVDWFASASSDGSVRIWALDPRRGFAQASLLLHPTYVYSVAMHPLFAQTRLVATGAYDGNVRIWRTTKEYDKETRPVEICYGHRTNVNAVAFDNEGTRMYSGDGEGVLREISISSIRVHPTGRKILITMGNDVIQTLDVRIYRVHSTFLNPALGPAGSPQRKQLEEIPDCRIARAEFSACGTYVYGATPDTRVCVWRTDTGALTAIYRHLNLSGAVNSIAYHPKDDLVAFVAWGSFQPLTVFGWDKRVEPLEEKVTAVVGCLHSPG